MTITIYGIASSRASRPLWVMEELQEPYRHVQTDYRTGDPRKPEFLAINPNGHIPAIDDDGIIVWESMACALYLARKFTATNRGQLGAVTAQEEAEILRWTFWTVTEVEKDALSVLMHRIAMPPEKRDESLALNAEKRLVVPLRVLEAHLEKRAANKQAFIAAARFTVADINVAAVINWARPAKTLMAQFPAVSSWLTTCLARPAYQRVKAMASSNNR